MFTHNYRACHARNRGDTFCPVRHVIACPDGPPGFSGVGLFDLAYPIRLGERSRSDASAPPVPPHCVQSDGTSSTHERKLRVPLDHRASIVFVAASDGPPEPDDVRGIFWSMATRLF